MTTNIDRIINAIPENKFYEIVDSVELTDLKDRQSIPHLNPTELYKQVLKMVLMNSRDINIDILTTEFSKNRKFTMQGTALPLGDIPTEIVHTMKVYLVNQRIFKELGIKLKLSHNSQTLEDLTGDPTLAPLLDINFVENNLSKIKDICSSMPRFSCEINNPYIFPEINQKPVEILKEDIRAFELKDEFHDTILIVGNKEFYVTKLTLAAASDYFRKIFTVKMKESTDNKIELQLDIQPESFEKVLEFIYTKNTTLESVSMDDLYQVTNFAQLAGLTDFLDLCIGEYRRRLSSKNFWDILNATTELQHTALKEFCTLFLSQHPNWITRHIHMDEATPQELVHMLNIARCIKQTSWEVSILNTLKKSVPSDETFTFLSTIAHRNDDQELQYICDELVVKYQEIHGRSTGQIRLSHLCNARTL